MDKGSLKQLHNSIIDYYRKKRLHTSPINQDICAPLNEKEFDDQKQYIQLFRAVKKLPYQCRKVLEFALFESMLCNKLSEKLHFSPNKTGKRLEAEKTHLGAFDPAKRAYHDHWPGRRNGTTSYIYTLFQDKI